MAVEKIAGGYVCGIQSMDRCTKLGISFGDETKWFKIHKGNRGPYIEKYVPELNKMKKFFFDGTLLLAVTAFREHRLGR